MKHPGEIVYHSESEGSWQSSSQVTTMKASDSSNYALTIALPLQPKHQGHQPKPRVAPKCT